jgi:hypothetical protein
MPEQYTPEQYQALFGQMVGKELEQMEKENSGFDPRGTQGMEIDKLTTSMIDGLISSQKRSSYETIINGNADLKYVVDSLISNQVVIPYMARYLDKKLFSMKQTIAKIMEETFPVDEPKSSK